MIRFAWKPSVISCRKTASCFSDRHNRSMKILSRYRPRPSIDILMSALVKVVIQPAPVYWLPWSVFIISGLPYRAIVFSNASTPQRLNASTPQRLNASTQKLASNVLESRQVKTLWVARSIIATCARVVSFDNVKLSCRQSL